MRCQHGKSVPKAAPTMVRRGLRSQGLQEKEVSILSLLLLHFFRRRPSAIRERRVDVNVPLRISLPREEEIAE